MKKQKTIVSPEEFKTMTSSSIVQLMSKDKRLAIVDNEDGERYIIRRNGKDS
ncbi:MAG: hypothetical protein KGZ82_04260 [Bacteroidales bacterium]|nr:hypothetical protein [Bacteroidales bacterium]